VETKKKRLMMTFPVGYGVQSAALWINLIVLVLLAGGCSVSATENDSLLRNKLRGMGHDPNELRGLPQRQPRIINGDSVNRLRYPYFSLMYGVSLCGAVIIAPHVALGAAHCKEASDRLRIGAFRDVKDGQAVKIRRTIVHPDYDVRKFNNDIILFIIEHESEHHHIQMKKERIDGGSFTVVGFGDTDKGDGFDLSDELHEVELEYVDNDTCDDGHGDNGEVLEDMMCAAGDDKDSCIGDSGGPMIMKGNGVEEDRLVGVVSWGRGCADDGVPGVYSRISYFYDWIVDTVCAEFPDEAPQYMKCKSSNVLDWLLEGREERREDGTIAPTTHPTKEPTEKPTKEPTEKPTKEPTEKPTKEPTEKPTKEPTEKPTKEQTEKPTKEPTAQPSEKPIWEPRREPSPVVSSMPSSNETDAPSTIPTKVYSSAPTTATPVKEPLDRKKQALLFLTWSPPFILRECQGDCDDDIDCEGDLICFKRSKDSDTDEVPGCSGPENIPKGVDICINPAFLT